MLKRSIVLAGLFLLVTALLAEENSLIWVFFEDKGLTGKAGYSEALEIARSSLSPAARRRRGKVLPARDVVGWRDLPVCYSYVEKVKSLGAHHRVSSNWLNGSSFKIPSSRIEEVRNLRFVREIKDVAVSTWREPELEYAPPQGGSMKAPQYFEYGPSYQQLNMLGIPDAHSRGYTGAGVRIGILDTGFELRHKAFQRLKLVAERDFLSGEWLWFEGRKSPLNYYQIEDIDAWEDPSGGVYVAFQVVDSSLNQEVYYSHTLNGGVTWSGPANISQSEEGHSARPTVLSYGDSVLVAWQDDDPLRAQGYYQEDIFVWNGIQDTVVNVSQDEVPSLWPALARSTDYFQITWATEDILSHGRSADGLSWTTQTAAVFPNRLSGFSCAASGEFLFVALTDVTHQLIFVESQDEGNTWSDTVLATAAESPKISASDGMVHIVYKGNGAFPFYNITYLHRDWNGWSQPVDLFTDPRSAIGKVAIASSTDSVWVIYEDHGHVCLYRWSAGAIPDGLSPDTLTPNGFSYSPELSQSGLRLWKSCGDDTTRDEGGDIPGQMEHGTAVLSVIGGYAPSQLYGPAFNAEFILAKTEKINTVGGQRFEHEVEEDWWVRGIEWAEKLGADIVSSSLGYRFVDYEDLDGNTAVTTRAADIAAHLGVLVLNAVGNRSYHGLSSPQDWLVAPADGDSVLAIGATDEYGEYDEMAAYGPLADGRDKPDVATYHIARVAHHAPSEDADSGEPPDSFSSKGGTSMATALVAGMCALVMEAHPLADNHDVREAVMRRGSLHTTVDPDTMGFGQTPNDSLGWGVPDVIRTIEYIGPQPVPPFFVDSLLPPAPNPFVVGEHDLLWFRYVLINDAMPIIRVYTLSGKLVEEIQGPLTVPGRYLDMNSSSSWSGIPWDPKDLASGVYIAHFSTGFTDCIEKFAVIR